MADAPPYNYIEERYTRVPYWHLLYKYTLRLRTTVPYGETLLAFLHDYPSGDPFCLVVGVLPRVLGSEGQ